MFDLISFDPVFRPTAIAGLTAVLAALAWAQARKTRATMGWPKSLLLLALRLTLVAGLGLILMRPMKTEPQQRPTTTPVFSIIVDRSASMQTKDLRDDNAMSRADLVTRALTAGGNALEHQLQQDWVVKVYEFSDQLRPTTLGQLAASGPPEGEETNIASALLGASEGAATQAGMLFVSDGRVNHVSGPTGVMQATRFLSARKIPVWTSVVGRESKVHDASLLARLNQNFLYARQPGSIDVTVDQTGYKGWPATVRLKREGVEVGTQQVLLGDGPSQLSFPIIEQAPGLFQYAAELDPLPGEADRLNNRRAVFARVTDHRTQVLVVEAIPSWDSKFMLRALRKDTTLDVTSFFQLNDRKLVAVRQSAQALDRDPNTAGPPVLPSDSGRMPATPQPIPHTRAELFAYDVIILGQGADRIFSAEELRLFKEYLLERGGNLIFARGKTYSDPSSPLADLEPMVWGNEQLQDMRLALTDRGREVFTFSQSPDSKLMLHELPTMLSVARVLKEKTLAIALAQTESGGAGPETATISWQHYGRGKVVSMGNSGLWRWSLSPDSAARYQGVYDDFWSQLVRWMAASSDFLPDQEITFDVNRNAFQRGEQVRLAVRTRLLDLNTYRPTLELSRRDGSRYDLELTPEPGQTGVFGAIFTPETEGEYKAVLHNNIGTPREDSVRFTVYEDQVERRLVSADPGLMSQIARVTGGEALSLDQIKTLPDRVKRFEQATMQRREPVDAWDRTVFFYLLIALLGIEWFVRRTSGLV